MRCVGCNKELSPSDRKNYDIIIRAMVEEEYLSWAQATSLNPPRCRTCERSSMSEGDLRKLEAEETRDFYEEYLREYFC